MLTHLAMTPEEAAAASSLPRAMGWMSCHFSPAGLQDLPPRLPEEALLILDDRVPMTGQDPQEILALLQEALRRLSCQALLLDFQRPGIPQQEDLAQLLCRGLSCPVGVSQVYAAQTEGPVFLSLPPAHEDLKHWIRPWQGRDLWLEIGFSAVTAEVTESGTRFSPVSRPLPPCPHRDSALGCCYGMDAGQDRIHFTLVRSPKALQEQAPALGISRTIGLYQELKG